MDFGLKKEERIHLREEIQLLFSEAESFSNFPFKVLHYSYQKSNSDNIGLKFAVSVPKRKFKKAVDRNLLKRRCREAYRLNRNPLKEQLSTSDKGIIFMLIYIANEPLDYHKIEEKIILILQRLQVIYAKDSQ